MKNFRRTSLILASFLVVLSCTVTFAQDTKQSGTKKNQTNEQKKQEEVFDVNNATLEETQNWLKKTLVKYGSFGSSRVESVKFKGCEVSYARSNWYNGQSDFSGNSLKSPGERMSATDFRNLFPNYSETVGKKRIDLKQVDGDKTEIVEKGKIFSVWVYSKNKDAIENESTQKVAPSETRDKSPIESTVYAVKRTGFVVTDKEIARQVKDAFIRVITLCQ